MVHIIRILSNRMWQSCILYILIAATSCQQRNQQAEEKKIIQVQAQQPSQQQQRNTKDSKLTFYLTRFSYTPEAWTRMMKNPEDRGQAARKYIESVGGKLDGFWYAFGEYDGYCL